MRRRRRELEKSCHPRAYFFIVIPWLDHGSQARVERVGAVASASASFGLGPMVKPWDDGKNERRRMKRLQITPLGWAAYVIAASVIVVDQASKYWVVQVFRLPDK